MKDIVSFWHDEMSNVPNKCEPEWMDAEDPLFILYTRYRIKFTLLIFLTMKKIARVGCNILCYNGLNLKAF